MSPLDTLEECFTRYGDRQAAQPLLARQVPNTTNVDLTTMRTARSDYATMLMFCSVVTGIPVDLLSVADLQRWITGVRTDATG